MYYTQYTSHYWGRIRKKVGHGNRTLLATEYLRQSGHLAPSRNEPGLLAARWTISGEELQDLSPLPACLQQFAPFDAPRIVEVIQNAHAEELPFFSIFHHGPEPSDAGQFNITAGAIVTDRSGRICEVVDASFGSPCRAGLASLRVATWTLDTVQESMEFDLTSPEHEAVLSRIPITQLLARVAPASRSAIGDWLSRPETASPIFQLISQSHTFHSARFYARKPFCPLRERHEGTIVLMSDSIEESESKEDWLPTVFVG